MVEGTGNDKWNTYKLAIYFQVPEAKEVIHIGVLERYEPEAFAPPGLSVQHDRRVDDFPKLGEELAHGFGSHGAREATNE